jgi:hypothetical protein
VQILLKKIKLRVLTECYANKCLAEELKKFLVDIANISSIRHSPKMGREKLLKIASRISENIEENELLLIIIDYERGLARKYIDTNFKIYSSLYNDAVHIAASVGFKKFKVIAIIFDPDIEEFLCRTMDKYCKNLERKMLKHGNQDRICRGLQSVMDIGLSSIIKDLAGALKKLLSEMPKQSITT